MPPARISPYELAPLHSVPPKILPHLPAAARSMAAATVEPQSPGRKSVDEPPEGEDVLEVELPPFRPYPAAFLFPNLQVLTFWIFNGGICKRATALLVYQLSEKDSYEPQCAVGCTLLATVTLFAVVMVMCITFAILLRFACVHRKACLLYTSPSPRDS